MISLGNRMKEYEKVTQINLIKKMPVILRIDGKAFHTYTRGMNRPWDDNLYKAFSETALELCSEIQGSKLAYFQSDEISILLTDYEKIETQSWFNNNLQKIVSISSSIATAKFNSVINNLIHENNKIALFDCRVFNLPISEVCNYFIWRQNDCTKNSIQMLARSEFSHKELNRLNCDQLQEKLFTERDINWNDISTKFKRGSCVIKQNVNIDGIDRSKWIVDEEIPLFTKNREYINSLI